MLTRPIDWELIRQQYDQMVKYATALGWAPPRPRRSCAASRASNVQHPTYKALAELGKAVKTIFLCRYLHDEALGARSTKG